MTMIINKHGNSAWDEASMCVTCKYCGCQFTGTVKGGDFEVYTENPKQYSYKTVCPECQNVLKF